ADSVHTYVGLGRLPRAGIVVNVDSNHRGYMWAIECGPPSEDARPLMGRDCNAPSPTSGMLWEHHSIRSRPSPYLCRPWEAATAEIVVNVDPAHRGYMWAIECGPRSENAKLLTADSVYIYVGLRRLLLVEIVVNVDLARTGYMWAIECGPQARTLGS
ncbi:hypothetical protein TorRG33x02_227250, partial [Trema orientale]